MLKYTFSDCRGTINSGKSQNLSRKMIREVNCHTSSVHGKNGREWFCAIFGTFVCKDSGGLFIEYGKIPFLADVMLQSWLKVVLCHMWHNFFFCKAKMAESGFVPFFALFIEYSKIGIQQNSICIPFCWCNALCGKISLYKQGFLANFDPIFLLCHNYRRQASA